MVAQPTRGTDALGVIAHLVYAGVGGVLVYGFGLLVPGAVEVQKDSVCAAMKPEIRSRVHGRLVDAQGAPIKGTQITFKGKETDAVNVDENGEFTAFVKEGTYTVTARAPDALPVEFELSTSGSEAIELTGSWTEEGGQLSEADRGPWMAPDFEVQDLAGEPVRLSEFRGRFVVLNFWATWCEPCTSEWPHMHQLAQRFEDRDDVVVLALSIDQDRDAIAPYLQRMSLTETRVQVVWDPTQQVQTEFGTSKIPDTYFVDPSGRVTHAYVNVRKWGSPEAYHCVDGTAG